VIGSSHEKVKKKNKKSGPISGRPNWNKKPQKLVKTAKKLRQDMTKKK